MAEKLVHVVNIDELRPGFVCVLKNCLVCTQKHRFMLLKSVLGIGDGKGDDPFGAEYPNCWKVEPILKCADDEYSVFQFDKEVEAQVLFRIEDGLDKKRDERQRVLDEAAVFVRKLDGVK